MADGVPLWQPTRRSEGQCMEASPFGVKPLGAPTEPEPRHVVPCSLVLPGPVRAEASGLRNGGSPVERRGIIPGDHGNDERGNQRQEGIRHREVYGYSRGEDSEGCNPMGATGTKQGRSGARQSARREAVRNRPCRLAG